MQYSQINQGQRYQIKALMDIGHKQIEIAQQLGVNKSTISRELRHNCGQRGFRPKQAHEKAIERRRSRVRTHISAETWQLIEKKLKLDWSPEQISGWMRKEQLPSVSPEWIYQYVYAEKRGGGTLYKHLRCQKKRRKRYGQYDRRGIIADRRSIEMCPAVVDLRERLGDWETDTMVTLTERKSRFTLVRKVTQAVID